MRIPLILFTLAALTAADPMAVPEFDGRLTCIFPVKDVKKSAAWYGEVLGFKILHDKGPMWNEMSTPLPGVTIGLMKTAEPKAGGAWLTFGVKDVDAARKRMEAKKVVFEGPTQTIPDLVKLASFKDPDGHRFKLFQLLQKTGGELPAVAPLGFTKSLVVAHATVQWKKSQEWYGKHLGLRLFFQVAPIGWCEMSSPVQGVAFGLQKIEQVPASGGVLLSFGVKDIVQGRKILESGGVKFTGETRTIPGSVKVADFLDSFGNKLRIHEDISAKAGRAGKE